MPDSGSVDRHHDLAVKVGRPDQRNAAEHSTDSIVGAVHAGVRAGQSLSEGRVPGITDCAANNNSFGSVPGVKDVDSLSWGRSGEISEHTEVPTAPSGSPPVRSHDPGWNAEGIYNNTKIGS